MDRPKRKRTGSVILWILALAFMVADQTDRLQKVVDLIPKDYAAYLPTFYGTLGLIALLLLNSAHKDDLDLLALTGTSERPKLKVSAVLMITSGGAECATQFEVQNFEDAVAVNVRAVITIPDTSYAIRFELSRVAKGSPTKFLPDLLMDGKAWHCQNFAPLETFMEEARQAFLRRRSVAAYERLGNQTSADPDADESAVSDGLTAAVGEARNPPVPMGPPLTVNLDLIYSNFDRTKMYSTPHVLTYNAKHQPKWESASFELESQIRIDIANEPEPEPTYVVQSARVS